MKTNRSSIAARVLAGTPFLILAIFLAITAFTNLSAGNRRSARASLTQPAVPSVPQPFNGTFDPAVFPCGSTRHHFTVPAGQARIVVQANATLPANDITVTLLYGADPNPALVQTEDTGVGNEALNYAPVGGVPAGEYQVQICLSPNPAAPPMQPFSYAGTFVYDDTSLASGPPPNYGALPVPPQDPGAKIGYENFEAPGVLTPVLVTSSGGKTVEYLGRNAIEPSIGANWGSGVIAYQSDLETLFVTFDDSCSLTNPKATWVNRPATLSVFVDSDPILFTDRYTNRTFASELTLLSPDTAKNSSTDDDGLTWTPDQTGGIASAVDHQTIGGGPYHLINGVPPPHSLSYPNAIYYCSQDIGAALCSRSDDGGLTYGPSVPMYSVASCGGLHGHVKVSPATGTVYVPNRDCGGTQSVVISKDNGMTWTVSPVDTGSNAAAPSIVGQGDDPAVAVDSIGRVYFVFSNFGGNNPGAGAGVAWSDDEGAHWKDMYDVGAIYGLKNVCFPTATAGDAGRAAVAFYGSTTPNGPTTGNSNDGTFSGVWHLYVAHTFDGGKSWTTTDVTPTLPMQRGGLLRGGGADAWRNLADFFDITVDKDGRVLVGYGNGCQGGNCGQAPLNPDGSSASRGNAYSATASIARQSSGRRMIRAKDPALQTSVPGMPFLTALRIGNVVRLAWNEADSGNSMINNYQIFRGTTPGGESPVPIATIAGTQTGGTFADNTATDLTKTYYYRVTAVNSMGSSCGNNEIAAPYVGDNCTGIVLHRNDPAHPESTGGGTVGQPPVPQLLIDYIALGEPPNTSNLQFKMKVVNLTSVPPNSRWRIAWDWFDPATDPNTAPQLYYIGMTSDQNSNVTYEYGTLADAGVPAVLVLGETKLGDAAGSFTPDGTITMNVPRTAVGNPHVGDLLGAIGGKTITGDTPATNTLERSTAFVDHTFIKGNSDNSVPTATYTIVGNTTCSVGSIVPVGAVSRKVHGSAGTFDVNLPLIGTPGIECRNGNGNHQVVITFTAPVNLTSANVTPGSGGTAAVAGSPIVNGSEIVVNLTNVSNAQTLTINLVGVSDGSHSGNVSIPMSVLLGDTTGNGVVNSSDVGQTQSQSGIAVTLSNFRADVTANGSINSSDVGLVQSKSGTGLP